MKKNKEDSTIAVYKTKPIAIGKEDYALKHDFS